MTRVLVLREAQAAAETAAALRAGGHEPLLLPVTDIVPLETAPPPGSFAAVLATSRNAVPALARHLGGFSGPVLAVGAATAARLAAAGLSHVRTGEGSAASLVPQAAALARQAGRPLLLALGRVRTPALEAGLDAAGTPFAVWETYDTRLLRPSGAVAAAACGGAAPGAVLLLSEGQARAFADLAGDAPALFRPMPTLLCLSPRIAAALPSELRDGARISADGSLGALFASIASTNSA